MINNRKDVEKAGIYIPELDGTDDIDPHIVYGDSEMPVDETDENSNSEKTDEPTERSSQEQHAEK